MIDQFGVNGEGLLGSVGPRSMSPMMAAPMGKAQGPMMQGTPQAAPRRRGMFGGVDLQRLGALLMAATGNPAGQAMLQQLGEREQSERQAQAQNQARMAAQEAARQQFMFEQDYRRNNPMPNDFDRAMQAANIDPRSEQGQALYRQYVENRANPLQAMDVQQPDGSVIRQFIRPGQQSQPRVFDSLPEGAVPIDDEEGRGGNAAGNFPGR